MSFSSSILVPEDRWSDVLHDIKVELVPAIMCLDKIKPNSIEEKESINMLRNTLNSITESSLNSLKNQATEPDIKIKAELTEFYQKSLQTALALATSLVSKEEKLEQLGEDNPLGIVLRSIISTQGVVDPSLPRNPVELQTLLNNKVNSHKNQTDKSNNTIVIHYQPASLAQEQATIKGDQVNLFKSIIGNCIENASKYAPNSTVTITIKSDETFFEIRIKDNGPGMPKEVLEKLQRGERVTTTGHGVGLEGLHAKVKSLPGSNIEVHSFTDDENHGTEFVWKFPNELMLEPRILAKAELEPSSRKFKSAAANSLIVDTEFKNEDYTVYFIDDNAPCRKLILRTLESIKDELARENPQSPSLKIKGIATPTVFLDGTLTQEEIAKVAGIITDVQLGLKDGDDGITVATRLREKGIIRNDVPIFVYSGNNESNTLDKNIFKGHIEKGLKPEDTRKILKKSLQTIISEVLSPTSVEAQRHLQPRFFAPNQPAPSIPSVTETKGNEEVTSKSIEPKS